LNRPPTKRTEHASPAQTDRSGHADPATTVLLEAARDGVARLTLNRPDALNALNRPLADALERALAGVAAMDDARVLLVSGRGRAFCAGNDIAEMGEVTGPEAEALARRWAAIMDRFAALPQVTIAVVDGELAAAAAAAERLRLTLADLQPVG